jgi:transposase
MSKVQERKLISDAMWKKMEPAVTAAKHSPAGAPPETSDREFLEALLFLNRTGSPWRDLPAELGYWHAVYMRFRRWEERGVWQRLWKNLQAEPFAQARELFVDSTTVRAHPHAAGAPKKRVPNRLWDVLVGDFPPKSTRRRSTKTAE